jgi:hypothetical protein
MLLTLTVNGLTIAYVALVVVGHLLLAIALLAGQGGDDPGGRRQRVRAPAAHDRGLALPAH